MTADEGPGPALARAAQEMVEAWFRPRSDSWAERCNKAADALRSAIDALPDALAIVEAMSTYAEAVGMPSEPAEPAAGKALLALIPRRLP